MFPSQPIRLLLLITVFLMLTVTVLPTQLSARFDIEIPDDYVYSRGGLEGDPDYIQKPGLLPILRDAVPVLARTLFGTLRFALRVL